MASFYPGSFNYSHPFIVGKDTHDENYALIALARKDTL